MSQELITRSYDVQDRLEQVAATLFESHRAAKLLGMNELARTLSWAGKEVALAREEVRSMVADEIHNEFHASQQSAAATIDTALAIASLNQKK